MLFYRFTVSVRNHHSIRAVYKLGNYGHIKKTSLILPRLTLGSAFIKKITNACYLQPLKSSLNRYDVILNFWKFVKTLEMKLERDNEGVWFNFVKIVWACLSLSSKLNRFLNIFRRNLQMARFKLTATFLTKKNK